MTWERIRCRVAAGSETGRATASDRITEMTIPRLFVGERSKLFGWEQGNPDFQIEALRGQRTIYSCQAMRYPTMLIVDKRPVAAVHENWEQPFAARAR